jgi:hypothetical protein
VKIQYPEDESRDGLRNVGFFTAQPFDPADSPRKLHHTYIGKIVPLLKRQVIRTYGEVEVNIQELFTLALHRREW